MYEQSGTKQSLSQMSTDDLKQSFVDLRRDLEDIKSELLVKKQHSSKNSVVQMEIDDSIKMIEESISNSEKSQKDLDALVAGRMTD